MSNLAASLRALDDVARQLALDPLVQLLLGPDEARRREALDVVLRHAVPSIVSGVVVGLIDALKSRREEVRRQATASLAGLGLRARPDLIDRIAQARSTPFGLALVEALLAVGQALDGPDRVEVFYDLTIAAGTAPNVDVRIACRAAIWVLRDSGPPAEPTIAPIGVALAARSAALDAPRSSGLPLRA